MRIAFRRTSRLISTGVIFALTACFAAADAPETVIKDRKRFIPNRKHQPLQGTAIGVLVGDTRPVLGQEGRSSAADILCFCNDGCSYRWVYVQALTGRPQITNLNVPILGGKRHRYAALNMASPKTVVPWNIRTKYTLVEVQINQGDGSPTTNQSFVATNFKVIEGSKKYPLKVAKVIAQLQADFANWQKTNAKEIDAQMLAAQKNALKNVKPNSKRKATELMYVTWMTKDDTLHVRFRTKLSNGNYKIVETGPAIRPFPLPVPGGKFPPPPAAPKIRRQPVRLAPAAALPPPPPRNIRMKVGTTFGVEFGRGYVVSNTGEITRTEFLPFESFQSTTRARPGPRFPIDPVRPRPLPRPNPRPAPGPLPGAP